MTAQPFFLTPRHLVNAARIAAVMCAVGLTVLLLGPFQGLERVFGLSDTAAHAIAFFFVTTGLFLVAPTWRRGDLAMLALGAAVLIELVQGLTGRSMSLGDVAADSVGVIVAMAPGLIEQLRWMARRYPDTALSDISARDRRSRPAIPSALQGRPARQRA